MKRTNWILQSFVVVLAFALTMSSGCREQEGQPEVQEQGEKGEVELVKNDQTGEITVDAEGKVIEPLKWDKASKK